MLDTNQCKSTYPMLPLTSTHIHSVDELMDPLGSRDIIKSLAPFTKGNVFQGILSTFVPIGQFEIDDGMGPNFYQLSHLRTTLISHEMCLPPSHRFPSDHYIYGMDPLFRGDGLLHLYNECLYRPCPIKPWGIT
jgi:hypothetical protein